MTHLPSTPGCRHMRASLVMPQSQWPWPTSCWPTSDASDHNYNFAIMPEGDAAVKALLMALKKLSLQAPTTLVSPSFDWSSKDQYDDFQLFVKSVNRWFTLQGIVEKTREGEHKVENPIRLEYVLNFLGNQGQRWYECWQPCGKNPDATKKKASTFLNHLQSTMDHKISIWYRIYMLEETWIQPGEMPDELVEQLRTLADRWNFPSDE